MFTGEVRIEEQIEFCLILQSLQLKGHTKKTLCNTQISIACCVRQFVFDPFQPSLTISSNNGLARGQGNCNANSEITGET